MVKRGQKLKVIWGLGISSSRTQQRSVRLLTDSIQNDYKRHYQLAVDPWSDFKAEHIVAENYRLARLLARNHCDHFPRLAPNLAVPPPEAAFDLEVRCSAASHEKLNILVVMEDWLPSYGENSGFGSCFRDFFCSFESIPLIMDAEDLLEWNVFQLVLSLML